jgi:hypothetical protein
MPTPPELGLIPHRGIFATDRSTADALIRIGEILQGGALQESDLRLLIAGLVINPEQFPRIAGRSTFDLYEPYADAVAELLLNASDYEAAPAIHALGQALRHELLLGWINLDKQCEIHNAIRIFRRISERASLRGAIQAELVDTLLSENPLAPIDVRGEAGDLFTDLYDAADFEPIASRFQAVITRFNPLRTKSLREHVLAGTDTIETPFVFPRSTDGRIRLLRRSAEENTKQRIFVDVMRVTGALRDRDERMAPLCDLGASRFEEMYAISGEYLSHPEAEKFIRARLTSRTRRVEDYIVNPNLLLQGYTVSALSRLISLSPEAYWPDRKVRTAWTAFARSVLGFSRVANIGLGAKMVYIPHGCDIPSLVYVGQATVIGKGVNIDLTGGVAIGRRNYTSAFWSDSDLHGHLHVGDNQRGVGGTISRLAIEPYIMILDDDIAFPAGSGYVEAARYAPGETLAGSIPGFRVVRAAAKPLAPPR